MARVGDERDGVGEEPEGDFQNYVGGVEPDADSEGATEAGGGVAMTLSVLMRH